MMRDVHDFLKIKNNSFKERVQNNSMSQTAKLNIKTPMCDFTTGKPIANLTPSLALELGIRNNGTTYLEMDIQEHRKEIPDLTIVDILNTCFDLVPLSSKTEFATYNNILIDIRNAKRQNQEYVEIDKSELELLKTIFEKGLVNKPELNRRVGFIIEIIEQTIADVIIQSKSNEIKTNS